MTSSLSLQCAALYTFWRGVCLKASAVSDLATETLKAEQSMVVMRITRCCFGCYGTYALSPRMRRAS